MSQKKVGLLFPGQGAQAVGMGKDFFDSFSAARTIFQKAEDILGYSLSKICFEGPDADLTRTVYAQPALYTTSAAALAILKEKFPELEFGFFAGLSLGEFTALYAASALSFEDGLKLVQKRAEAMEKCAQQKGGTMASVMGLAPDICLQIAQETGVQAANLNAVDQIVLSGPVENIEKACKLAEEKGAKRAIVLKVGGAFHSPLMADAEAELRTALKNTAIQKPQGTFVPNVLGTPIESPEEIRELLAKQLTNSVQWIKTMDTAGHAGISLFLEVGTGKVLKGLARKVNPPVNIEPFGQSSDIEKLSQSIKESSCC